MIIVNLLGAIVAVGNLLMSPLDFGRIDPLEWPHATGPTAAAADSQLIWPATRKTPSPEPAGECSLGGRPPVTSAPDAGGATGFTITNGPDGALDIFGARKTLVQAQIVSNSILPSGRISLEETKCLLEPIIDFIQG